MSYAIKYSDGSTTGGYDTVAAARAAISARYPAASVGHAGDLSDGGTRTLVWATEDDAIGDDGQRAVAAIVEVQS